MADVAVIGGGVIGLSTALELARAGATVHIVGASKRGAATDAAAGLLAPTIGELSASVRPFFDASLRLYPAFVDRLREHDPDLSIVEGLIEVGAHGEDAHTVPSDARVLAPSELAAMEPSLAPADRALLHPTDGAIDNVRLAAALRRAVAGSPIISQTTDDPVVSISLGDARAVVTSQSGARVECDTIVLAAGAWSSQIAGLPRPLPVTPLKGQMLAVESTAISHAVVGDDVYLVPRRAEIVIGATTEVAGFDLRVSTDAIEALRSSAVAVCPALSTAPVLRTWAGVRPASPDMLPILGADPSTPRLVYACGHSKNGILLAPGTAAAIAALITGGPAIADLAPFSIARF